MQSEDKSFEGKDWISLEGQGDCIEIDLKPLLRYALQALKISPFGWLANKVSETKEMIVTLMRCCGYVEHFELGRKASQIRSAKDVLDHMEGRLIVRCITSVKGGRELIKETIGKVVQQCDRHLKHISAPSQDLPEALAESLMSVFRDHEGITAAMFNAARNGTGTKVPRIYLSPQGLRTVFKIGPKIEGEAWGARQYRDEINHEPDSPKTLDIESALLTSLGRDSFFPSTVIQALKDWEQENGQHYGESLADILRAVEQTLVNEEKSNGVTKIGQQKRKRLSALFVALGKKPG